MTAHFAPDSVYSTLEALKPNLNSIDVRTIAVKEPECEDWVSLVTSINITANSYFNTIGKQATIPTIKNFEFAIFHKALKFNNKFFEELDEESLKFKEDTVKIKKYNLTQLKMSSYTNYHNGQRCLEAIEYDKDVKREALWNVVNRQNDAIKRANYRSIEQMLKAVLETDNFNQMHSFIFRIASGIKLTNPRFEGCNFLVDIKNACKIRGLQLNYDLQRVSNYNCLYETVWRPVQPMNCNESVDKTITVSKKPPSITPYDQIRVELVHTSSALTIDECAATAPLTYVSEPFYKTFSSFCSFEEFKQMLLEPEHHYKNPQRVFENAITWLFSLCGFQTINLAEKITGVKNKERQFDELKALSGYQIGSADIIAYEDNEKLLIIDCDIGCLDDKKIDRLIETSNYFRDRFENRRLNFIPVLCTIKRYTRKVSGGIAVIDAPKIELMLEEIAKGNRKNAKEQILYSFYS